MAANKSEKQIVKEEETVLTREDLIAFLDEIEKQTVDEDLPVLHTLVAMNSILRLPNANELFTEELKEQARTIWSKVKASGVEILDPPFLFDNAKDYLEVDEPLSLEIN